MELERPEHFARRSLVEQSSFIGHDMAFKINTTEVMNNSGNVAFTQIINAPTLLIVGLSPTTNTYLRVGNCSANSTALRLGGL